MTYEKTFLTELLKSFVHGEKLNYETEPDWAELMRLASIHSVTGILGYMVMKSPCEKSAPIADTMRKLYFGSISVFLRKTENARRLMKKLDDAGIDHMPFKGFTVRDWYPVPELRSFGDVDMLIRPQDREKSHALMQELGYSVKNDWEPVYSYYSESELYEIHTRMMEIDISDKADYQGFFAKAWENAVNVGGHRFELKPEFHFLYLLTHIAKHIRGSGAGIRMYMDLALFIKQLGDEADWACIESWLEELKLRDFANLALTLTEKCFAVKSPIALRDIAPETLEDFLDYTLDGGVFGFFGRDSGLIALKNAEDKSRAAVLASRLFPSASSIEARYTYLQGRHWLLPAAWVHRFVKTRDSLKKHSDEAKSILQTDEEEVEKLKRVYKETGL